MATTAQERRGEPQQSGGGLPGAIAAEWTKLWGLRSTWLCLGVAVLLTGGTALLASLALQANGTADGMTANALGYTSTLLSQFAMVAAASLLITGEYATGAVRTTLTTVPARARVVLAKVAVLAVTSFATGCVAGAAVIAGAAAVVGDVMEFEAAHVLHEIAGTGGYFLGISLFTLGLGLLVRSTAGTLSIAFGVLLAIPSISQIVGNETVTAFVDHTPPMTGASLMSGATEPYGWGTGALLLAAWAALALAAGYTALARRDA
ncbi:ABC transporter permease [Streptomonospora halophila]